MKFVLAFVSVLAMTLVGAIATTFEEVKAGLLILEKLKSEKLITESEYGKRRNELLQNITGGTQTEGSAAVAPKVTADVQKPKPGTGAIVKIEGAFGMKFGQVFETKGKTSEYNDFLVQFWHFTPTDPIPGFEGYCLQFTEKDRQVDVILARREFPDYKLAKEFFEGLSASLIEKHGAATTSEMFGGWSKYIKQGDRNISISVEGKLVRLRYSAQDIGKK